ncbi:hypothetical protein KIN20_011576 [Parelaphostrongylus tenuis]|uniref:Uncharacterized protein n=1 Tax=Parelaphostrongylus tenuis TaxID=148309 RepID=A0AAD5MVK2_PARTN|nr:hypothetical protein KIN20_011576 [Parelaphostrongylus tenuis]
MLKTREHISKVFRATVTEKENEFIITKRNEINRLEQCSIDSQARCADLKKQAHQKEEELRRLVVCGEEEAKSHERAYELGSSRLKDLRSLKENLSSVL